MPDITVHIENLTIQRDTTLIIDNLSFDILSPEIFVILGPNGAGKSTLLRALAGIIPYQGKITWHTTNVNYLPPQETFNRENSAAMTVADFFSFKTGSLTNIKTGLYDLGMPVHYLEKSVAHLSTGEFQRMLLAWSVLGNPDVLLLDEPSAGIDISGEEKLYEMLHTIWQQRKITLILVTHNLHVVRKYAHRVLCINKNLVCQGYPTQILTQDILEKVYGKVAWLYEHTHT